VNRLMRPLALGLIAALNDASAFTVMYLRHAQGGHNVKGEYDRLRIGPDERPVWVGNTEIFTPLGEHQRLALVEGLRDVPFDFIACSPVWRTRQTILPYLKATGRTAELWPELAETAFIGDSTAARAGQFDPSLFSGLSTIELTDEEKPHFRFRADRASQHWMLATNAPQAAALALRVEELLRTRFDGSSNRVLLVGHGTAGLTLVRILAKDKSIGPRHLQNTHLWKLDAPDAGPMRLIFHDQPAARLQRKD